MSGRALVLGGGGPAGSAWSEGVVAGLLDGGPPSARPSAACANREQGRARARAEQLTAFGG